MCAEKCRNTQLYAHTRELLDLRRSSMNLSDIWGATDKPEPKTKKETLNDKAWDSLYVDELINSALNDTFDAEGMHIMKELNAQAFELTNIAS